MGDRWDSHNKQATSYQPQCLNLNDFSDSLKDSLANRKACLVPLMPAGRNNLEWPPVNQVSSNNQFEDAEPRTKFPVKWPRLWLHALECMPCPQRPLLPLPKSWHNHLNHNPRCLFKVKSL